MRNICKGEEMYTQQYYEQVRDAIDSVYKSECEKIDIAGKYIADAIEMDGLVHVFGCGHSHMIAEELFYRAGGLAAIDPIFEQSAMLHEGAVKSTQIERMSGYAHLVAARYPIKKGDVFIIASSSGINSFPIEMADVAKTKGVKTICITSKNYSHMPSRDKRGYHLLEMCDICIDNQVPCGDATVAINENGMKAGPISSINNFFLVNMMCLSACEELQRRGIEPPVFKSGNINGGDEYNLNLVKRYMPRVKHM